MSNPHQQSPFPDEPSPREPIPGYGSGDQDQYGPAAGGYSGYPTSPGYQTQPYQQGYGAPSGEHPQGTLILIFGILGFFLGIFGPVAWVMGSRALREIQATGSHPVNEQQIRIGRILGIIVTALLVLGLALGVLLVILAVVASGLQ